MRSHRESRLSRAIPFVTTSGVEEPRSMATADETEISREQPGAPPKCPR